MAPRPKGSEADAVFQVTIPADIAEHYLVSDLRDYILDAVSSFKGSFPPEEPLFDMERKDVKVVYVKSAKDRL